MKVEAAAGSLGAHVTAVDLADAAAEPALRDAIVDALHAYEVLFFPDQHLEPTAFAAFARSLGPVESHPAYDTVADAPDVQILESTPERPSKIELWHSDMTFRARPPALTLLHARQVPDRGGDTLWASAAAAYAALDPRLRALFDGLGAVHDFRHGFRESLAEPGGAERLAAAVAAHPPVTHPLVRTHPHSGKRALYANRLFTTHLTGLSRLESEALLDLACRQVVLEEFTVRLRWRVGTVALWDNRVTQHKPVNDYFPAPRRMHRVTIAGEAPA